MSLSRRDFLRSLLAAAVATQLPPMPEAQAEPFIDRLTDQLFNMRLNGRGPDRVTLQDVGNGWTRVISYFDGPTDGGFVFDATQHNGGRGLLVCSPQYAEVMREEYPDDIIMETAYLNQDAAGYTMSALVKTDENGQQQVRFAQLEQRALPPQYIETRGLMVQQARTNLLPNSGTLSMDEWLIKSDKD